jgi:hypothetical protein
MMETASYSTQSHWALTEEGWFPPQSQWQSMSLDTNVVVVPPLYSQNVLFPSYVPYYDFELFDSKVYHIHDGMESPLLPVTDVHAEDFVPVSSTNWSTAIVAPTPKTVVAQVAQVAIEDQLNSQSLYKTELCRSFEETGTCRYGAKCQFAHGKDELRPVLRHPKYKTEICRTFHNSGSCPYGKRCRFIHLSADEGNLNSINIIPWTRNYEEPSSVQFVEPFNGDSESFDVDEVASKMRTLDLTESKGLKQKSKSSRKGKSQRRKNPNRNQKKQLSWEEPPTPSQTPPIKSTQEQNESKRRLAFFARLSGDTGIQSA